MWCAIAMFGTGSAVGVWSDGAGPSVSSLFPKCAMNGGMSEAGAKCGGSVVKSSDGVAWRE
jgi:hypothetical protein